MIIRGVKLTGLTVADAYITTQNLSIWLDANNTKLTPTQIGQNYGALRTQFGV